MSEYNRSRERSRSPMRMYHNSRSQYRCENDRDWIRRKPSYDLPSYDYSNSLIDRERWIDEHYRKRNPTYVDSFKSRVYSNHIIANSCNENLEPKRLGYISKPQQINTNVRVQKNNEIPKVPTVLETLLLAKKDDDYNPKTALRMNLQESKKVKSDFIDLNDEDDDVIFVTDSRTSPPEVITIVDNDKDDGGINLMSVCRQLIVLEEYLKENNVEIRSLFNEALTLERANLNSSKSLLNNSNLKFLGSLMEKMKDVVVSGLIPDNRTSFAKKLIHDVIYLVENTEEVVGTIENEVIEMETEFMNAEEILEKVDDDVIEIVEQVTEIDVIEMELEVPKELDQKVSIREPEILPKLEQELLIKKPETPTKLKVLEATIVKEPEQDVPSSNIEKEPEQSTKKTPQDIPSIEKPSTSDIKPPVDISKYDNKRMKIAVDIGKALLASGKKVVTPEELDALVNVYLAVTADMSDSESDDE